MNPVNTQTDGGVILYDADVLSKIDPGLFEPEFWRQRRAIIGEQRGRGTTWIVRLGNIELVLRHYRRGGLFGPLLKDRYLWQGIDRSRAMREWRLLASLYEQHLPVPRPVAARTRRHGLYYRCDLITQRIDGALSLALRLARSPLPFDRWHAIGRCVRRFHDAGVYHADLNAHNILLAGDDIYLVDFDRGRLRAPGRWRRANLARLRRSLLKLSQENSNFGFDRLSWKALLAGYDAGAASSGQSSVTATT